MVIGLAVKMTEVQIRIEQRFVLEFLKNYIFSSFLFSSFLPLEYFILETVITLKASLSPDFSICILECVRKEDIKTFFMLS